MKHRALVVEYGSLLVEYRALLWKDTSYAIAGVTESGEGST